MDTDILYVVLNLRFYYGNDGGWFHKPNPFSGPGKRSGVEFGWLDIGTKPEKRLPLNPGLALFLP